jgi:parvulin-like peptidyl-prolyl isomerase
VITDDQAAALFSQFSSTWQRAPSKQELQSLIDDEVRTEVYVREAMKLGLDQNDTIIRRRLRQKMEFLNESQLANKAPDESELEAYFTANSRLYRTDAEVSFRHVFFDPQQRGDSLADDVQAALLLLKNKGQGIDLNGLGDPIDLADDWTDLSRKDLVALFGSTFTEALLNQPLGRWSGPIESAYGRHLVRVESVSKGEIPLLEAVRTEVSRDWAQTKLRQNEDDAYQRLLNGYSVRRPELTP